MRKDGAASLRSEHLIPCLDREKPMFVGIKTGKQYDKGCISYIGVSVSSDDIMAKLKLPNNEIINARKMLDEYLMQLKKFKIGNVVSVSWSEPNMELSLRKEEDRPISAERRPKLP